MKEATKDVKPIDSSFATSYALSGVSIENARRKSLEDAIGSVFKIEDSNVIQKGNDSRVVYSVRTLNSTGLPIGTTLKVSVKDDTNIFDEKKAFETLAGTKSYVVRFINLGHWIMGTSKGLLEGLTAERAEIVNVPVSEVVKVINHEA